MRRRHGIGLLITGLAGLLLFSGCAGPFRTLTPDMIRTDLEGECESCNAGDTKHTK